ncbi:uncharacterized protein [Diabrotica undecimpunctata]|uniref:uncharacterized protein n=1 Tax=Diabrotica undecimpunctata TaxID=50387 RepID=UPI003B63D101
MPLELAKKYTTDTVVATMKRNVNTEKAKLIFEACNFTTTHEVISKFLSIDATEDSTQGRVLNYWNKYDFNIRKEEMLTLGIFMDGLRLHVELPLNSNPVPPVPKYCGKCSQNGHTIAKCPQKQYRCPTCGQDYKSTACPTLQAPKYTNCQVPPQKINPEIPQETQPIIAIKDFPIPKTTPKSVGYWEFDAMDQLTVLKRKRGIFKAQITKFDSFISSFTHDKIVELQVRVDKCKEWCNDFDQIQSEIDLLDTSEEQLQERLDFQDAYFKLIASAEIILKNEVNLNDTIANSGHNTSLDRNSLKNVRLPPLEVPTFNGCYQHWLEFRDSFTSMVIENSDLNDVDKLHYLKRALIGDAQDELEQLKTTSKNFTIAWQLLSETYEKKKLIARGHIEAIYEYPKITQVNSLELKKLSGCIKRNLKSLGMLGYPVEHWDVLLLCTIEKKLDYYTNKEWQEKGPVNEFSTIQEFLAFIDHKVQHLQNSEGDKQDIEQISKETKKRVQKMTLSKSFIATSKKCALCNLPHYFYSCKKFHNLSVSARRQEVTKSKACWNCLKDGHLVQHCTWGGCKLCGKRHNTLLHNMDGKFINNSHLQTNATQLNGSKVESQICSISTQKETHTQGNGISNQGKEVHIQRQGAFHNNSMEGTSQLNFLGQTGFLESHSGDIGQTCFLESHSGDIGQDSINFLNHSKQGISYRLKTDILLSTALVYMQDKYGILHECRVLLDSGSQSNFISRSFFEKLQLRADKVHIPVKGLGQGITNISQALNGTLLSKFSNYQTNAFLLVIDKISDNLPTSDLNLDFINIPKNIVLADETFGVSKQIDVLLGASVFWQLLCVGQIKLGKDQPILQKTKLGWVISGPVSQSIKVSNNSAFQLL